MASITKQRRELQAEHVRAMLDFDLACGRQRVENSIATAGYEHTLHDIQQLHLKFDALCNALGVVIVPGPEAQDEPTIAYVDGDAQRALAAKLLDAEKERRALVTIRAHAETMFRDIQRHAEHAKRDAP